MATCGGDMEHQARYRAVRAQTEALCRPLLPEDYVIQSMPDVSPPKWHLAHTTWFFETFVLAIRMPGYQVFDPSYHYLFNSYYETAGDHLDRRKRGTLSRPTIEEIYRYRAYVDSAMCRWIEGLTDEDPILTLGLHHEQQHQELLVTDIKHILCSNSARPKYRDRMPEASVRAAHGDSWLTVDEGLHEIGAGAKDGFSFDNERPRHRVWLDRFELASRPVTAGEFAGFIQAGGYERPELWLSAGWDWLKTSKVRAPLYWERAASGWRQMTLEGEEGVELDAPVCHVSYFEADAYARWKGCRLPTEAEWEVACENVLRETEEVEDCNFLETGALRPLPGGARMLGDVWEWTSSAYAPYPGFRPLDGALGEYNGKFMCNQYVLRGGSCATPRGHIRRSYRNFFPPDARWQFSGIRLARG